MKSDAEAVERATAAIFVVIMEADDPDLRFSGRYRSGEPYVVSRALALFIVRQLINLTMDPEEVTSDVVRAVFMARDPSESVPLRNQDARPYVSYDLKGLPARWWKVVNAIDKRLMATVKIRAEYPEDKYNPFFTEDLDK